MKNKFIKKALSVFTAMAMMLSLMTGIPFSELGLGITVSAAEIVASGTCGAEGNESSLTWSLDSDGTLTISGSGAMWDYSTANIGSKKRAPWYEHKDNVTTVIIEEGVTTIGTYAFWMCAQLTEITISATVTTIGNSAFFLCEGLIQITIPQSVTSIGEFAFSGCRSLTSVTLPNSISTIQQNTFANCTSLTSITIPEGVTTIGPCAFCDCTSLNSITIPEGVTTIGDLAFGGCTSLETIVIPSSVTTIGANVFDEVPGVSSEDGFLIINGILMKYTGDAANVEIPSGVTEINQRSFEDNQSIVTVKIPSGVTTLGNNAFFNCDSLVSVELPETLISMESSFIYCDGLKEITIPNGMETIGRYAFGECTSLEKVTIPNSVTEIGDYAFENIAADATINAPCSWNENPLYTFADGITVNIPAHQNLTYSVNDEGNVINNECSNCGKVGGTLTINAEGGIYDRTTKYGATVEKTGTLENEEVTVNYYQGVTFIGTDAPINAGTYTAKITYEDVTASCQFEIAKATPTADMFTYTSSAVYDGTAKSASVVVRDDITGVGEITNIKYYQNDIEVTPVNAGTYTVKIDVADGDIYDAATDIEVGTFEITKATPTRDMFTATPSSELVYDGSEKSIIVTTDKEGMGTFTVSYDGSNYSTQFVEAAWYIVDLHIEEGDNYNAVDTLSLGVFEIKKAAVTVTANSYTIKVGSALPTYEYTVTGLVNGETLPIDVTISCNAADGNTTGTFDIVVSGVAESDNYTFSYVNGTLTVSEKVVVDAPTFTPASGTTFASSQKVTISCATDGATIYYTTDGSTPTTASTKYTSAITITSTTTIKAIAVKDGMDDSSVVTAKYTKNSGGSGGSGGSSSSSSKESPNIEGKNGKKGWSAISDVIEDTKEGEKVVIDMNDATEIPRNILKEIKGKDITIVLNMDNGFIWTINGKDVENPETIDMGVKKGTRIPVKVINEVTGESEYIEITLSHNGDFGFKAVLTVDMGKNNKGNFANLYYYNKFEEETEIVSSDEIDENGKADLTFTHASEYVIVIDDTDHTDLSAGESIKVEEIVLL